MTLGLYRSTVEDRVEFIKKALDINGEHDAFLRLVFYLVTGLGYNELEPEDITDGHGEYQIDSLHIDTSRRENSAIVTLLQVTYSESLSSTKLIKMHAGLDYLLIQPKSTYSKLSNLTLRDKIQDFRSLRSEILPSNINLQCFYVTLGNPEKSSREFLEQVNRINLDYRESVGEFSFKVLGPAELFELLNFRDKQGTPVNDRMRIIYDQNKANLLEHSIEGVSGVICTVKAEEIARVVNQHPSVFDDNLRRFLGFGGAVNRAIRNSCKSSEDAPLFWFLNNGISIVCDEYDVNKDSDDSFVDLKNMRIVNGCQTSTTIASAAKNGELLPATRVMLRIFKTKSEDLASKLVITTNNQTKITSRDLHSKDKIQEDIQAEFFRRFNINYERTPNEFSGHSINEKKEIISNQKIGQAYLGIVRKRPGDASRRQYKVWGEHYDYIFNPTVYPESYLLVYKIVESCNIKRRELLKELQDTDLRRIIVSNGIYHLARAIAFLWRGGDDWNDINQIRRDIQKLEDEPELLDRYFEKALEILNTIFENNEQFLQDPSVAMKSSRLDEDINKALYLNFGQGG